MELTFYPLKRKSDKLVIYNEPSRGRADVAFFMKGKYVGRLIFDSLEDARAVCRLFCWSVTDFTYMTPDNWPVFSPELQETMTAKRAREILRQNNENSL